MKKILTALFIITLFSATASAKEKGLGLTIPVFLTQMGIAEEKVEWGYPPSKIEEDLVITSPESYAAEYNSATVLFINMSHGGKTIRNVALSFIVSDRNSSEEFKRSGLIGGEEQYRSLCTQLILALNPEMSAEEGHRILKKLGLFGPVLDGRQRYCRQGGLAYIMRLQKNGAIMLVISAL